MPVDYMDSLRFLGCNASTLNLAQISVARTDKNDIDLRLAMAWQTVPWSESSAIERCVKLISDSNISTIYVGENIPFGLNLQPYEAWITSPTESLIDKIDKLGISVKYCSN